MKSGNLNFLGPSGPLQACNGTALPFHIADIYFSWAGSSVGIATELRAGRSGIESRWGRDFPPVQTGPGAHPASCTTSTGSFPGVRGGRGVGLTSHPLLECRGPRKIGGIILLTLRAFVAYKKGKTYLYCIYFFQTNVICCRAFIPKGRFRSWTS